MNSILAVLVEWWQTRNDVLLMCGVLIFLACIVVMMEFREDARKEIQQRHALKDYTFPARYMKEVQQRYPHLSLTEIERAYEQLRVYFRICWKQSPDAVTMPSRLVDVCWHTFIIDTRAYQQFCQDIFGRFLHHQPNVKIMLPYQDEGQENTQSDERRHQRELAVVYQAALAVAVVGTSAPKLFQIDQEMSMQDGFIYSPEMLKFLAEFDLKANESSAANSDLPAAGVICADLSSCSDGGATASSDGCSGSD